MLAAYTATQPANVNEEAVSTPTATPVATVAQKGGKGVASEDFAELEKTLIALLDVETVPGKIYPEEGEVSAAYALDFCFTTPTHFWRIPP